MRIGRRSCRAFRTIRGSRATTAPLPATTVSNPGGARLAGRYVMVFRHDYGRQEIPRFDGTSIGLANSFDGLKGEVDAGPVLDEESARGLCLLYPRRFGPELIRRICDPRITVLDGRGRRCFAVDMPAASAESWPRRRILSATSSSA